MNKECLGRGASALRAGLLLALLCAPLSLSAQTGTAVVLGTVTDPQGAVVPRVAVTATNVDTGRQVRVMTDTTGAYRIPGLFPGDYEVKAERASFAPEVHRGITLTVSQQAVVNFTLRLGTTSKVVVVSGAPLLVESTSSAISGLVNPTQMRQLPLNGRDIFQLVLLQPGAQPTPSAGASPWQKGGLAKVAVNGQRPTSNNLTIDGMDANDPNFDVSPGGASGVFLGVDGIREFRVFTSGYSAEYGRNAGSVIQLVTKSGTNNLHGSLFEFHRNAALDAKNYFDLANRPIPPFVRNQFGGSLGGPIQHNRTFFFVSYEGFRERLGITAVATVPDALAHQGLLPLASNPGACTEQNPGGCAQVGVNPAVAPFLAIVPTPNGTDFGNGTGLLTTSAKRVTREDYGLMRLDHTFSGTHSVFGRYILDDSDSQNPYLSTLVPGFPGETPSRNQYFTLQDQKLFHGNWLNLAAFGFNRTTYLAMVQNQYPNLTIAVGQNRPMGFLNVAGLNAIGNNFLYPFGSFSNTFQADDNVSWEPGHHAVKFGGEYRRLEMNGPFDLFVNGEYNFQDLSFFGVPYASNNPPLESLLHGIAFSYLGTNPQLSNSDRGFRQNWLSAYVQDDWQATARLMLNLGVRYEFYSNPTEAHGRAVNIRNVATATAPTVGSFFAGLPEDLFSPRLGFAWMVTRDQKTVLRGGAGIFRDQIWANLYGNARSLPPFYQAYFTLLPTFQNPLQAALVATTANATMTYNPKWPTTIQYNLDLEREVTANSVFKLGYVGARGNHLVRMGEANPFEPALGHNLNPNFGSLTRLVTDAQSFYNSMQASFEHRTSHGLTLAINYTWAHSVDDASGAFPSDSVNESGKSQNFFNRKGDRGRSSFDIRQNLVFDFVEQLPFGPGQRFGRNAHGLARQMIGGWTLSGIGSFHTNVPFTPVLGFDNAGTQSSLLSDRPNLVGNPDTGTCPNGAPVGTTTCWFNPQAFALPPPGSFGNAGRNILSGPAYADFDLAFLKEFSFGETRELQFRAEIFNLANHPNFAVPTNTEGPNGVGGNGDQIFLGRNAVGQGVMAPNAGQIFSTVSPSRQIQFGLKFLF
jgi:hypothetical protein